ncbi:hypothetical protein [Virgibacillus sp. L01]
MEGIYDKVTLLANINLTRRALAVKKALTLNIAKHQNPFND